MGWSRATDSWEFRSDEPRHPRAWIEVTADRSRHVVIENHGEHLPGAESVVVVPDRPIGGVSRFLTTNGQALFDPNGRWLIIEGVKGFVALNLQDDSVSHFSVPEGSLIGSWSIAGGVLEWKQVRFDSSNQEVRSLALDEIGIRWEPGLGPFSDGEFQPDEPVVGDWDEWDSSGDRANAMLPLPSLVEEVSGAFTVNGNRGAAILAFAAVVTSAVIVGLVIGGFSQGGFGSDLNNLLAALMAMLGLAPGLVLAESLVRFPRWIHFGSDLIVVQQIAGEKRRQVSRITEIRSVRYLGSKLRLPVYIVMIYFSDGQPLRIDSDMLGRSRMRDVEPAQDFESRLRDFYGYPGTCKVTKRWYPDVGELLESSG